jgi:hypothetical protein
VLEVLSVRERVVRILASLGVSVLLLAGCATPSISQVRPRDAGGYMVVGSNPPTEHAAAVEFSRRLLESGDNYCKSMGKTAKLEKLEWAKGHSFRTRATFSVSFKCQ